MEGSTPGPSSPGRNWAQVAAASWKEIWCLGLGRKKSWKFACLCHVSSAYTGAWKRLARVGKQATVLLPGRWIDGQAGVRHVLLWALVCSVRGDDCSESGNFRGWSRSRSECWAHHGSKWEELLSGACMVPAAACTAEMGVLKGSTLRWLDSARGHCACLDTINPIFSSLLALGRAPTT